MLDVHLGPKPEPTGVWDVVTGIVPHLLWTGLLLVILFWIGRDGLMALIGRVRKVGVAGVEIEFKEALESAAEAHARTLSAIDLGRASRRLARERALVEGARLLWIDNQPDNNKIEISILESAGARVDTQVTSAGAKSAIDHISYDAIVSDIDREGDNAAGLNFATSLTQIRNSPPVIFYVGAARKPVPSSAFGITDRPDELIHLVLDALARRRS
jgi:CheY-like chemotaxis protein